MPENRIDKIIAWTKNNRVTSIFIFLGIVVITFSTLIASVKDLKENLFGKNGLINFSNSNIETRYIIANPNCLLPKSHLEYENLKGAVESVRTLAFKAEVIDDKVLKGGKKDYASLYDNSLIKFNYDGMLKEALYYDDSTMQLIRREVAEYNNQGCPISSKIYTKGKLDWGESLEYDYDKREIITSKTDENNVVVGKRRTKIGKFGEEEVMSLTLGGKIASKTIYKYNEHGEVYLSLSYDSTGKLKSSDTTKYDYNINSVTRNYGSDINVEIRNDDNLCIESYSTSRSNVRKRTYLYEYDKMNNWIRMIEYNNSIPIFFTERTIKYY